MANSVGEVGYTPHGSDYYIAEWEANGMRAVIPAADQLQIDIDSPEQKAVFERAWPILLREIVLKTPGIVCEVLTAPSASGEPDHYHITVTIPGWQLSDVERIACQAALGSDPVREILSLVRCMRSDPHPTLFKEKA